MSASQYGQTIDPFRRMKETLVVKAIRQFVTTTNNPSRINQNQTLLVQFPNQGVNGLEWPEDLALQITLESEDDKREHQSSHREEKEMWCWASTSTIFWNSTFYTDPRLFDQRYTIFAEVHETVFPLVFGLLSDRTERTYTSMFNFELSLCTKCCTTRFWVVCPQYRSPLLSPRYWCSWVCLFHLTQCLWRRRKDGLTTDCMEDPEVKKLVWGAAALPLVPLYKGEDVWFEIIKEVIRRFPQSCIRDVTIPCVEGQQLSLMSGNQIPGPTCRATYHKLKQHTYNI